MLATQDDQYVPSQELPQEPAEAAQMKPLAEMLHLEMLGAIPPVALPAHRISLKDRQFGPNHTAMQYGETHECMVLVSSLRNSTWRRIMSSRLPLA